MREPSRAVRDVVDRLVDSEPVEWDEALADPDSADERQLLEALQTIERIYDTHSKTREQLVEAPDSNADNLGSWSHLQIIESIGEGRSAEVFRALDTDLKREVALKCFHDDRLHAVALGDSALREGQLLARIRHVNVATVYGVGRHEGKVGLWMELVEGETLAELIDRQGPLSATEAVTIGIDVCRAIAAIHQTKLIHRDLKAQNIMRERGGRIVVVDFGLGWGAEFSRGSHAPHAAGTPLYMAPELFRGEPPSVRTDIYAVGVLMYYLVTGEASSLLADEGRPRRLLDLRPDITPEFARVVDKAMAEDEADRFQTAGELEEALRNTTMPAQPHRGRWNRRHFFGAATLVAIVSLWGLANLWFQPGIESIVVIPFRNETGDPSLDYLSAGITYNSIGRLSQLKALRVLSGHSAEKYAGEDVPAETIARDLRADAVLLGSLRRAGEEIALDVELIDDTGSLLWAERIVSPRGRPNGLEEKLASRLESALGLRLTGEERSRVTKRYTESSRAYELYQTGRFFWNQRTETALERAIVYFEEAIEEDPDYAQAYAGLADAYALVTSGYFVPAGDIPSRVAYFQARTAAEKALALDDHLVEAHASMGLLSAMHREWEAAERHYKLAIELSPSYVTSRQWYSRLLSSLGRYDEAAFHARAAVELDPASPLQHRTLGFAHYDARQYLDAIDSFRRALELEPEYPFARDALALSYWYTGQESLATTEFARRLQWRGTFLTRVGRGQLDLARDTLTKNRDTVPRWMLPLYFALAGDDPTALGLLEELVQAGDENISWTLRDRAFDHVASEPRFLALIRKAGLPWRAGDTRAPQP